MTTRAQTVTILFTDLVSSTELLQRAGDEHAQRIFRAHHQLLRQAVQTHGGHEVKWLGDGLMVAFSSAVEAVRCAIAMQQAARRPAAGERLEIRVGLNVGEAFHDESDYFGTPVVVARRLCDKASAGQIYVSDIVLRLLAGRHEFRSQDLGALTLKGIADRVPAHEILYEHDPLAMLAQTPFVGRAEQLEALRRTFDSACAGSGGMAVLVGEPGIGKTRTAEEFCDHAQGAGAQVLWGRCYEGDWAPPFSPFSEAIRRYAETADGDTLRATLGSDPAMLARIVPALRERLPDLPGLPPLPSESERYRLLEAVSSFFSSVAARRPLVLVLDDLHWADSGTIALLRHVARGAKGQRLLLIGTYRDIELSRQHPLAAALADLRRETAFERIALKGLEQLEVERLLDVVAEQDVPDDLVRAISDETAGNPFFIREVLLHLLEEGKVVTADGVWRTTVSVSEMSIPEGVREVIGRRLSRLSEPANRLLAAASAFDGGFSFDILASVSGGDDAAALDAIDEALAAQVLQPAGAPDAYEFSHALIRHTLYEELSPSRRVRLHRQIGEAIETHYSEDLEPHLGELAYHFYRAAGAGDVEKAVDYSRRAGDQARAHLAHEDALTHYQHALELHDTLAKPNEAARLALLLALGEAQGVSGASQHAAALETYLKAIGLARDVSDVEAFAQAALGYHDGVIWSAGSPDDYETAVVPLWREALERFGARTDAPAVKARARLGWALYSAGHDDEALRTCNSAISLARSLGDPDVLAFTIDNSNFVRWRPDLLPERLALSDECVALYALGSDGHMKMWSHFFAGVNLLEACQIDAAEGHLAEAARYAHEVRIPVGLWYEKIFAVMRAFRRGNFTEAETRALDAFAFGQRYLGQAALWYMIQLGYLRTEQGRLGELLPAIRAAVEQNQNQIMARAWRAFLGFALLETGSESEAQEQVGLLLADGGPYFRLDNTWLFGMTFLAEAAARIRDDRCDALYDRLHPYRDQSATVGNGALICGSVSRPLGLLATALEHWDEAEGHFTDALERNTNMGLRPWIARTQMNYAEMLLARDGPRDRDKARGLLDEALAASRKMGMAKVAADCAALGAKCAR